MGILPVFSFSDIVLLQVPVNSPGAERAPKALGKSLLCSENAVGVLSPMALSFSPVE